MPTFSAGLALGLPGAAELVYLPSFPFRKSFWVSNAIWYSVLELEVMTSYEGWTSLADVQVNGTSIGKIPPRSFAQTGGALAPVSFTFQNGVLETIGAMGRTGNNQLEIIPPTSYDYLIVGNWRFHYQQQLAV